MTSSFQHFNILKKNFGGFLMLKCGKLLTFLQLEKLKICTTNLEYNYWHYQKLESKL